MRVGAIVMLLGLCVPALSVAQDAPRPVPGAPGRINWRRIEDEDRRGTKKDLHTAAELTDVYLASVAEEDMDSARAIERLIARKPEADVLAAAAKMLDTGRDLPTCAAALLAYRVLAKEPRTVTVEECAALEEIAAKILAPEFAMPEIGIMGIDDRKRCAARILAVLGTPRATELLVKLVQAKSPYALALREMRHGDVPQLVLGLVTPGADHFAVTPLAEALGGSAEGRAELRALLDPKSPFGWKEYGPAKGAAYAALINKFQELEDLKAIESVLQQRPAMLDPIHTMLPYSKKTPEQAEAVVAFLSAHEGAKIEDALLLALALLPQESRADLVTKLEAVRPGARERVEAKRKAWDEHRTR